MSFKCHVYLSSVIERGKMTKRRQKLQISHSDVIRALCYYGQHSLTSVERSSYLRSDFVNVWRHARLVVPPLTRVSFASIVHSDFSDDLMFVSRFYPAFSIILRLIQTRRCHCICLERMFFNVSPRSSLLAHQQGPFNGCYWVTSLEWPRVEWHSWRIARTSK